MSTNWFTHRDRKDIEREARHETPLASNSAYEGADSTGFNASKWITSRLSPNAALANGMALDELRQRSRQAYRSKAVGGVIDQDVDLVVSTGFTPQAKIAATPGFATANQAKKYNQQLEMIGQSIWPTLDINGQDSLWDCSRLVQRCNRFDGESLTILSDKKRKRGRVPLVIEVVDTDRLSTPPEEVSNPLCRFGVLKDRTGEITHYYIQKSHPNDDMEWKYEWEKVPAERVCHVFEKWFPDQARGLPWFTRVLVPLLNGDDLEEAGIVKAQVEACFVGTVTPPSSLGLSPEQVARNMADLVEMAKNIRNLQPGTVNVLMPGAESNFSSPSSGIGSVGTLQEVNFRTIAEGLNVAFEMLRKDWRGVSFAGGRLILQGMKQDARCRQKRLVDSWLSVIWNRMVEEAVLLGKCSIPVALFNEWPELFQAHKWMAPAWGYAVNPVQEVQALVQARNENLITGSQATAEYSGEDYEATVEERAREREAEREADVVPPSLVQPVQSAKKDKPLKVAGKVAS